MRYYLLTDSSTQWFNILVSLDGEKAVEIFDLPTTGCWSGRGKFSLLVNICGREPIKAFDLRHSRLCNGGDFYGGWSISEIEFNRLKKMIELTGAVNEFERLANSV